MLLRKIHKTLAIAFSPFLIITAATGILLLFRKAGLYGKDTKEFLIGIHNWEGFTLVQYAGILLGAGLLLIAATGLGIAAQTQARQRAARRALETREE
jgi:uncharacterized iron-regulated membrane protein